MLQFCSSKELVYSLFVNWCMLAYFVQVYLRSWRISFQSSNKVSTIGFFSFYKPLVDNSGVKTHLVRSINVSSLIWFKYLVMTSCHLYETKLLPWFTLSCFNLMKHLLFLYAASVPDSVKAEMLQRIRSFLASTALWCDRTFTSGSGVIIAGRCLDNWIDDTYTLPSRVHGSEHYRHTSS